MVEATLRGEQPASRRYWRRQGRALIPFGIWAAYGAFFALHVLFRSVGDEVFPWRSLERIDHLITGTDPSWWLQRHLYGRGSLVLDKIATGAHLSWFGFPIVVGLAITVCRRDLLPLYLCWLTVTWFACDALFLAFPVTPPWMADHDVVRILFTRGWIHYVDYDSNPVAAFPSLHACVPTMIGLFVWTRWRGVRWLAWASWAYAAVIGFSVVYLGEHWLFDVVGGYAMAVVIALSLIRLESLWVARRSRAGVRTTSLATMAATERDLAA